LNDFQDFRLENGSNQGQILALTGFFVPFSLGSDNQGDVIVHIAGRDMSARRSLLLLLFLITHKPRVE